MCRGGSLWEKILYNLNFFRFITSRHMLLTHSVTGYKNNDPCFLIEPVDCCFIILITVHLDCFKRNSLCFMASSMFPSGLGDGHSWRSLKFEIGRYPLQCLWKEASLMLQSSRVPPGWCWRSQIRQRLALSLPEDFFNWSMKRIISCACAMSVTEPGECRYVSGSPAACLTT